MRENDFDYICGLSRQFILATGTLHADPNSKLFQSEFNGWLRQRQLIGNRYAEFICHLNATPLVTDVKTVEVGKGGDDSIALDLGIDVLTNHTASFNSNGIIKNTKIEEGAFKVVNGEFVIVVGKGFRSYTKPFTFSESRRVITQNPYCIEEIKDWEDVHNSNNGNITFGVYGSLDDKDVQMKISQVEYFRDKLDGSYVEDYTFSNGNYFYAVSSDRKILKLNNK